MGVGVGVGPPPFAIVRQTKHHFFLFIQKVLKRSPVKKVLIGVSVRSKEMLGIKSWRLSSPWLPAAVGFNYHGNYGS